MAAAQSRPPELAALNGLRGAPAIAIVLFHYCEILSGRGFEGYRGVAWFDLFVSKSYMFVDFFFVLSGFVLYYVYGRRFGAGVGAREIADFGVARVSRLYPVHFVMLLAMLGFEIFRRALWAGDAGISIFDVPSQPYRTIDSFIANLFLVQAWHLYDHLTWNPQAWFVSAEFALVLLFPVLVRIAGPRFSVRTALLGLGGVALLMALAAYVPARPDRLLDITYKWGVFRGIAEFAMGIAMGAAFLAFKDRKGLSLPVAAHVAAQIAVIAALLYAIYAVRDDRVIALLMAAMVWIFAFDHGPIARLLASKPLKTLGHWSYGIYLGHVFLIYLLATAKERHWIANARDMEGWTGDVWFVAEPALIAALAVLLGAALARYVEGPGGALIRHAVARILPPRRA